MKLKGIAPTKKRLWATTNKELIVHVALDMQAKLKSENMEDTYGILVCAERKKEDKTEIRYKDIEKDGNTTVPAHEVEDFENNHIVIDPNEMEMFEGVTPFKAYEIILIDFYRQCINTNNEQAKQYVLNKYSTKIPQRK